jgi:hypothetical protein
MDHISFSNRVLFVYRQQDRHSPKLGTKSLIFLHINTRSTVVMLSKARTYFALLNTVVVGSNPTRGMYICGMLSCVGRALATG